MTTLPRQAARVATVAALVVASLPLGSVGQAANPRTTTELGGFSIEAEGSPLLVLVDDPNAAIPRPTGTAAAEADPNYTLARVSTGPNALGLASTVWPGNLLGTGLPAIDPRIPQYPLKAESRYPDKPYSATGPDTGVATSSTAEGLDATALADGAPTNKPGQVMVGDAYSHSVATVTDKDVASGTVTSSVKDVSLLGGVIKIDSVTTQVTTLSDGKKPTSTGKTTVSGLTVNGVGYTVDETGAHVGGQGVPTPPLVSPSQLDDLGIKIEGVVQTSSATADTAKRRASGLVIHIDTKLFKSAISPVVDAARGPYSTIVGSVIPVDQQGYFYYLLNATPNLTFVFGAARSSSAAVLPISFDFPPPSFPSFPGGVTGPPSELPRGDSGFVGSAPDLGTGSAPAVVPPAAPVLSPPGVTPAAFNPSDAGGFGGIGAGRVLLALAFAGGIGWLLSRLLAAATGLPLGIGCRLGAPTSVPDLRTPSLRSVTA